MKRWVIGWLAIGAAAMSVGLAQNKTIRIGISNGFVGSEWRTQMLDDIKTVAEEYKKAGISVELVIQSADVDVQGQIQQIRNLINAKVDGILINPNSQTGLNQVIKEATDAGIKVVVVDQEVSAPTAINVAIDQRAWAKDKMDWLAKTLGGKGNIVIINGIAGHPANEARVAGERDSLKNYPGIKVLNSVNADWDQAKGQQVMSSLLASQPNIDGVFTQDGMGQGVLRALIAAKPQKMPVVSGEAYVGYMKLWTDIKKSYPNFKSYGLANPPGVGASGLRVLINLVQGKQLKDGVLKGPYKNTLYVPIPAKVDDLTLQATLADLIAKGKADTYTMDGYLTQAQANNYFK
ncbi:MULTISPECIES: substrate-binding domain-containing protein [unclassified Meiothermus]|uniref:substrate-binding domain-containing protein n=1 Tax=unclassified Meiothermus TaxID=370471 RepID=UPI0018F19D13|nr:MULTISPECIES: substrate-binding domain-containing protein [unclassified Meiothermus]